MEVHAFGFVILFITHHSTFGSGLHRDERARCSCLIGSCFVYNLVVVVLCNSAPLLALPIPIFVCLHTPTIYVLTTSLTYDVDDRE